MENRDIIPYIAFESIETRNERHIKRLTRIILISVAALFLSNAIWLYAWLQFDYEGSSTTTTTVDGEEGNANYLIGNGEINNGKDNNRKDNNGKENQE
jgi:hypothetical protein